MKNATRYCAGPAYYRMCSIDVYCSKQPAAVAPKETITHHFFVSGNWAEEKLSMQPKFVAAQKMLLKQNPANIRKWIARFYYFRHLYSAGSACVLLTIIDELPIDRQLYLHCSLIYFWVPSSCFCIVISLFLRVKQLAQRCSPSGGRLHYPRRRQGFHTD